MLYHRRKFTALFLAILMAGSMAAPSSVSAQTAGVDVERVDGADAEKDITGRNDTNTGPEADEEVSEDTKTGPEADEEVQEDTDAGSEEDKAGQKDTDTGPEADEEAQENTNEGAEEDKAGQKDTDAGPETDEEAQENTNAGPEEDKAGQKDTNAAPEADREEQEDTNTGLGEDRLGQEEIKTATSSNAGRKDEDNTPASQNQPPLQPATPSEAFRAAYSLADGSYECEDGIYTFEAEYFYSGAEAAADGQAANLQPHTEILVPLPELPDFTAGTYVVEIKYAGNGQVLKVQAGNEENCVIGPDTGFDWSRRAIAVGDRLLSLKGTETLAVKADTEGKYGWVDWIRLSPVNGFLLEARDFVHPSDKVSGDGDSCANMDPGVVLRIPSGGRFNGAVYELSMWTCGNGREYEVQVNGQKAGSYVTTGSDFGMTSLHEDGWQGRYELKAEDELVITAPDGSYGWIKGIMLKELPGRFYQKDPDTGITVESEEDLLPKGTQLKVKQVSDRASDEWFKENGMRAVYYEVQLKLPSRSTFSFTGDMGTGLLIEIPLPPGFSRGDDSTDIYYINEGEPECLHGTWSDGGTGFRALMESLENGGGIYALTTRYGTYRYEAEEYYGTLTDGGKAANFEKGNGDTLAFGLGKTGGFSSGVYNLLIRYCGGGEQLLEVLVNKKTAGTIRLPYTDWGDYRIQAATAALHIKPGDEIGIRTPEGQYHWVDYLELKEAEDFEAQSGGITAAAPAGTLPYGTVMAVEDGDTGAEAGFLEQRIKGSGDMRIFRLYFYLDDPQQPLTPAGPVEIRMGFPADYNPDKFCLYHVSGEGQGMRAMKVPAILKDNEICFSLNGETGVFALVDNASYVPAGYDEEAIYSRRGGIRQDERNAGFHTQVRSRTADGRYIYEGEAYYKALADKSAADLQPGAQLSFQLSDNPDFTAGTYRLTVRSNGNRQMFTVKVNHEPVGNISRYGTGFEMYSMTDDAMEEVLALHPSDLLTIEAEGGQNYGWVDYAALERVTGKDDTDDTYRVVSSDLAGTLSTPSITYRAADHYGKKTEDSFFADLQPGESISFRAGDHPDFREGTYRIAVTSNGNRTRLLVRQNGAVLGSIVRVNGNGFDRTDMTRNVLGRNIRVQADDVITLEAPGSSHEEGPWGWVGAIELIQPPSATGTVKDEYRYEGEDYYQASLYSPAADLQAGESIHIPLSDDADFQTGIYRLSVLSNGTRQMFQIEVNGRPVGTIGKKAADYSDIDYSQDYMEGVIPLSPADVLTITGQEGDYFGWVNYILLEREE